MYSFAQLRGVRVIDEPLYGHYLRVSGADHPGRQAVMKSMNCNGNAVMLELFHQQANNPTTILFAKHMAHHLVSLDLGFLRNTLNVFLIRDPQQMLPSLAIQLPNARLADTGLKRQWQLYRDLCDAGLQPVVLDSRELLLDPAGVLKALCSRLNVTFDNRMLSWDMGPRPEDGIWAVHWYHAVHRSTGFSVYKRKSEFPDHLQTLLEECQPWYANLYEHALRAKQPGEPS